jgi:hypothetical protein
MPDTNSTPDNLDAVLRKYGKIWIWSILSAAVAAFSLKYFATNGMLTLPNLTGILGTPRSSPWSPLAMLLAFLPSLGALASVYFLLQFLRHHIVPILFPPAAPAREPQPETQGFTLAGEPIVEYTAAPVARVTLVPDGGQLLYRAFAAVVIAMAVEAAEVLLSNGYRAVAG